MNIYLETIFLENFLIDLLLLIETAKIAKFKAKKKNLIMAAIISSIYICIMLVFKVSLLDYALCKMLLEFVTVYIAFRPKRIKKYIKNVGVFFLISIVNVGAIIVLQTFFNINMQNSFLKILVYVFGFILAYIFTEKLWKIYKCKIKEDNLIYEVHIKLGKETYKYNAFLDTGNTVFNAYYNVPIIFAEYKDKKMQNNLKQKESFEVAISTISNENKEKAYLFKNIKIKKEENWITFNAGIVFVNNRLSNVNKYNMILNYLIYEESLGGIEL